MAELVVELLSEDIPARMQRRAAADFGELIAAGLAEAGLSHGEIRAESGPRRLSVGVADLPRGTRARHEERRGPRADAPDKAVRGFLRSVGLDSPEQLERRETRKGAFWFAHVTHPGRDSAVILPGVILDAIQGLSWPKSMRWGAGRFRWVRPLHGILAVFDGAPLAGQLDLGGDEEPIWFTNETCGHRFLAPAPFAVTGWADYAQKLEAARVIPDRARREQMIESGARRLAEAEGLTLRADPGLVAEVAGLVEWPVALIGGFDPAFREVPEEALISAMRGHQKYFALLDAHGRLANRFVVIANMDTPDGGALVARGNEKVLSARLADARFFWDQDRAVPLHDRVGALGQIVFHDRLGTLADRTARLEALAVDIAHMTGAPIDATRSAAVLAKADLVTGMVDEFPELQGVMGCYYALESGEGTAVADAIAWHYKPAGPADACPTAPVSVALALADRMDLLVGFFGIDEKPTGSKDPFALRRAALGVIRLILENELRLPLGRLIEAAWHAHGGSQAGGQAGGQEISQHGAPGPLDKGRAEIEAELVRFFGARLAVLFREEGIRHDLIQAVFALGLEDDLVRLKARVAALRDFLDSTAGVDLLVAYRRAANILRIEEKKDGRAHDPGAIDPTLMDSAAERRLAAALETTAAALPKALEDERFAEAMAGLAELREPVDAFFDAVTVNADDPALRANRLALLAAIRQTMNSVADFAHIEGGSDAK